MSYFDDLLGKKNTPIKRLKSLHLAICLGATLFIILTTVILHQFEEPLELLSHIEYLPFIALATVIILIAIGEAVYRKYKLRLKPSLDDKALRSSLRKALLIRWFTCEFGIIFCVILFQISNFQSILYISICALFFLISRAPSRSKLRVDLGISTEALESELDNT